jgi:hypothetical protein
MIKYDDFAKQNEETINSILTFLEYSKDDFDMNVFNKKIYDISSLNGEESRPELTINDIDNNELNMLLTIPRMNCLKRLGYEQDINDILNNIEYVPK